MSARTLLDLVRDRAASRPTRGYRFLGDGARVTEALSYAELDRDARRIAAALQERVRPGDRVLIALPPGLATVKAFWACLYAGAIAVIAPPPSGARPRAGQRLNAIAGDATPALVLTSLDHLAADADAWREPSVSADDVAFLQYTSGSTGAPRGVAISHANALANLAALRAFHLDQRDLVMLHWLPLHHDMGLVRGTLSPLHMGGDCVMMAPLQFAQRPLSWLAALTSFRATTTGAPCFGYEMVARRAAEADGLDLSALRIAFCSAEPVQARTVERFIAAFAPHGFSRAAFRPAYGLAEATVMVTGEQQPGPRAWRVDAREARAGRVVVTPDGTRELVSCGHAFAGHEVAIVGDGRRAAPDRAGEIWVRGPSIARGYWGRGDDRFEGRLDDGTGPWLRTGDLGWVAPDGGLCIVGRIKDLVIVRGENHEPHEIEATVERAAPELRAGCSAVFGVEQDGTDAVVVVAEVRERPPDDVFDRMRAAVSEAHDLALHAVRLVAPGAVPKTSSGKVQRSAARDAFLDGAFEGGLAWSR